MDGSSVILGQDPREGGGAGRGGAQVGRGAGCSAALLLGAGSRTPRPPAGPESAPRGRRNVYAGPRPAHGGRTWAAPSERVGGTSGRSGFRRAWMLNNIIHLRKKWMRNLKELSDGKEVMKEHGRFLKKMNQGHLKLQ